MDKYTDDGFFNSEECANYLGISKAQLKKIRQQGLLFGCYTQLIKGGSIYYSIAAIKEYMAKKRISK